MHNLVFTLQDYYYNCDLIALMLQDFFLYFCSVLAKSYLGAKHDFEIWADSKFSFFGQEKQPLEWLLDGQT